MTSARDITINQPETDYGAHTVQDLDEVRQTDQSYMQYRFDMDEAEEYADGNQFTFGDLEAADANGIQLTIANYVKPVLDDMRGIQEACLTNWKVHGENPAHQSMYDALGSELNATAKALDVPQARVRAFGGQSTAGIAWLEIGRSLNPLEGKYYLGEPSWREMFFDLRCDKPEIEKGYVHRVKNYDLKYLQRRFRHIKDADKQIAAAPRPAEQMWLSVEAPQKFRAQPWRRERDFPMQYQSTPRDQYLRSLEELWMPVYLEGVFAELPNGKIMLYDPKNPMLRSMANYGMARLSYGEYVRWRVSMWCGDFKLVDEWSPFPWRGHPYIAFIGYREKKTRVPYGVARGLISLQDEINSATAKMHFGMDAVRVTIEEGALSSSMSLDQLRDEVGNKRFFAIMKKGKLDKIKIENHGAVNEQNFKRAQDAKADMRNVSGIGALNPAQLLGAGVTDDTISAVTLRAMAGTGELAGNYKASSNLLGERLLDLISEDMAYQGNVQVNYRHAATKAQRSVVMHETLGYHADCGKVIGNDVTLLKREVLLQEIPTTVTYRGKQLSDQMKLAQSMPESAMEARTLIQANVVRLSDTPNAEEVAEHMLVQAGLAPPTTPEQAQELQKKQQDTEQNRQLQLQTVTGEIQHKGAQTAKLMADADLKKAMAATHGAEASNPQYEQENQRLMLERTEAQNRRTNAQAEKIERELEAPPPAPPPPPVIPERW